MYSPTTLWYQLKLKYTYKEKHYDQHRNGVQWTFSCYIILFTVDTLYKEKLELPRAKEVAKVCSEESVMPVDPPVLQRRRKIKLSPLCSHYKINITARVFKNLFLWKVAVF